MLSVISKRLYSSSTRRFAEVASNTPASSLVLNFVTPHASILNKKVISSVTIPGEAGEYGVTVGHSPIISQLQPGIVTVTHTGGESEKYFVPGGFALTHPDSVTDVSVPEAFAVTDFDESAIKSGFAEATKNSASENAVVRATAQIELSVYTALARSLGITL